jgi:hypothetical protein
LDNPNDDKCPGNYTNPLKVQTVIILGKVVLWILHLLLERYIQHHHSKARNRGYHRIYRSTRHLKSLTVMIHSTGKPCLSAPLWLEWQEEHVRPGMAFCVCNPARGSQTGGFRKILCQIPQRKEGGRWEVGLIL